MEGGKIKSNSLTKRQRDAVQHFKGPALVIAGPGAGKTFVITERVKKLILSYGVDAKKILVTTFTEKAADELKVKLAQTLGSDAEQIHISTVHSFCKSMLEKYFLHHEYGANINVLDEDEKRLFIELNKAKLGISYWKYGKPHNLKKRWNYISDIMSFYSAMTRNRIKTDDLIKELKKQDNLSEEDEKIIKSYDTYLNLLYKERKMDFSLLQTKFLELIENNKNVLEDIKSEFEFLLVDEYQDTSPMQDKIFRYLTGKKNNIFVVGDENQSIYGFRGASIRNFKNFVSVYPNAKEYFLKVNFRSSETIVNFSNNVFEKEMSKILEAKRRKGEQIRLIYGKDSEETAKKTVNLIKKLKENEIISKYGDVALLFRSVKGHSPEYIKYLSKEGIPFVTFGDEKFLDREEIRNVIYLMSYVTQELYLEGKFRKWSDWWRKDVFLSDFFDFSDKTKEVIKKADFNLFDLRYEEDFKNKGFSDREDIKKLMNLNRLKYDVQREKESFGDLQKGKNSLLKIFYKILNYSGYFTKLMEKGDEDSKEKLHNLGKFSEIISKYLEVSKKENMKGFLWYMYNHGGSINQYKIENENTVKILTVHRAKGLEFPVVFLCCLNEGRFPLSYKDRSMIKIPTKFLDKEEGEEEKEEFYQEERRLFYVGVTRAQDNLIFTASDKHRVKRFKKSRFLEIVEDEITYDSEFKLPNEKEYQVEKRIPALNYSAINAFIDCPLRYTLTYDFGFVTPPSFMQNLGTFIHNTLQRIHENMKEGKEISPSEMREIVDFYWMDLPISKKKNDSMKKNLVKEFVSYYIKAKDVYKDILAIEESFSHIDDNMIIRGKIDLIVKDKDGDISLIDFKARKKEGIEKTNVDKQLQIYAYCLDKEYDIDKLYAYTFQDNKMTKFPVNKQRTKKFLKDISKKIAKEDFHKQKNEFCKDCQFNFYCWGEKE